MYQFYMRPYTPLLSGTTDAAGDTVEIFIYVDGVQKANTKLMTQLEAGNISKYRHYMSGFFTVTDMAAGEHTIELRGRIDSLYMLAIAWGISLEAYYQ